eukprot:TRINITY_DN35809_c0_g1_i1.p1 TRINITY_DN35809_c0_g1~~TRINITY_DN35809_c0_g1_i1.p1  ORF type:complete len:200 (+),score=25.08 TRINITY_DN35809_c0_g1_i1:40-600(+)
MTRAPWRLCCHFAYIWCLLTAVVLHLCEASAAKTSKSCPFPTEFSRWMKELGLMCNPPLTAVTAGADNDANCDWITCPCLEVSLQVPVELASVPKCFEEGVLGNNFTEEQRKIASELIRDAACGARTRELGKPCGECDRYRMERPQCFNTTMPPFRTFISASHRTGPLNLLAVAMIAGSAVGPIFS